jgi:hypothetical protein
MFSFGAEHDDATHDYLGKEGELGFLFLLALGANGTIVPDYVCEEVCEDGGEAI